MWGDKQEQPYNIDYKAQVTLALFFYLTRMGLEQRRSGSPTINELNQFISCDYHPHL